MDKQFLKNFIYVNPPDQLRTAINVSTKCTRNSPKIRNFHMLYDEYTA